MTQIHYRAVFNGLNKDLLPVEPFIRQYIDHLRTLFYQSGGSMGEFPQYLKDSGCEMTVFRMKISDTFMLAAKLTMEQ